MQKETFKLVPAPEFRAGIEDIAGQYPGLQRLAIYGYSNTGTLVIQAQYTVNGEPVRIYTAARGGASLEDKAATLQTMFYNELIKRFEIDLYPVDQM